ncbi:hypothetical protein ACH5RR_017452 [Cinchona calisaya]|uniref:Scarecrow-like protein 13 n=1 Tax=Cinchona calisaya TaxID=153742 RepID=A0ABD2ZNJ3_9GENT
MKPSQASLTSEAIHMLYHQPFQQIESYSMSPFQVLNSNICADISSQGGQVSFQACNEQFFTLESLPVTDYVTGNSPSAARISSNGSPFSPQCSQSYMSYLHHYSGNTYGSPLSGSSGVDDGNELRNVLRELEIKLMEESEIDDSCSCSVNNVVPQPVSSRGNQVVQIAHTLDLKQLLLACAEAVSNADIFTAEGLMNVLEHRVSLSGEPIQRLSGYMMEGLRARWLSSGSIIYQKLKRKEPSGPELMTDMHVLYQICPYYKFAYMSSKVVIGEAMENENKIHIIDFCIAQGSQWISLIQALAHRPGGPPYIRITGVDDSLSLHARGGGLDLVGQRLSKVAASCGVPFEFHGAAISGCEVQLENLQVRHGEALAVNFPYMLHHMPDESVNTMNHRDWLLRLIKSLSPKVVTLVEQESNTNTAPFYPRFCETLDYYTAMFESIDDARPRDDKQRISAEEHCIARDIVNIVACEGAERVERHELFGKWRVRLTMAGFVPCPLSFSVCHAVRDMLKEYSPNYRLWERDGALYLGWKSRALATCSAWR